MRSHLELFPSATRPVRPARSFRLSALVLSGVLLSGCTVIPEPLTDAFRQDLARSDRQRMFSERPAVSAPLTMEEAVARSLKYNLDHRLAMMEGVLRSKQLDAAHYEMLPDLAANAGWTTRSNEYLTMSAGAVNPTQSQDKRRTTADLGLTWNVLDFGVSYYQAKQNADQVLIARERQRKIVNQIVQQVRSAYWRAATAELLQKDVAPMLEQARKALVDARAVERGRLSPPAEILQYQKGLVGLIKELEQLERDRAVARSELTGLMGLPPGTTFSIALPEASKLMLPEWKLELEQMEEMALLNRPELREEQYQKRIAAHEARKALLRLLPGVTLNAGINHDSNSYLVNNDWTDAGLKVTWNLLNIFSGPKALEVVEAQQEVGEWRRMALSMAVLTQVHVGYQQFLRTRHNFEQAHELNKIEQRIYGHVSNATRLKAQTPLQNIRAHLTALYAEVGRYYAYAEMQGAVANLHVTLGMDLLPPGVIGREVQDIQAEVRKTFDSWYQGRALDNAEPPPAPTAPPADVPAATPAVAPGPQTPAQPEKAASAPAARILGNDVLAKIWADAFNSASRTDFKSPFAGSGKAASGADTAEAYADRVLRLILKRFSDKGPAPEPGATAATEARPEPGR